MNTLTQAQKNQMFLDNFVNAQPKAPRKSNGPQYTMTQTSYEKNNKVHEVLVKRYTNGVVIFSEMERLDGCIA